MRRSAVVSMWTTVDGLRLHARRSIARVPARAPAVLVHGLGMSSRYMLPTLRAIGARRPAVAPDLPGHGRSAKPDEVLDIDGLAHALGRWIDEVGLPPAILVANSMGCQVATALAARRPGLVRALLLVGPTMDADARRPLAQTARLVTDSGGESVSLVAVEAYDVLAAGILRTAREFRHALDDAIEERLPGVEAPTLVVRGSRDAIVPRRWAEDLAARAPRGTFEEVPGPHVLNWTAPDALAARVDALAAD